MMLGALSALLAGCSSVPASSSSEPTPVSEVLSAIDCAAAVGSCLTLDEARNEVGFDLLVPFALPERFGLYSIQAFPNEPPPTQPNKRPSNTLALDYRLLESLHVPGVLILETAIPANQRIDLVAAGADCGERLLVAGNPTFIAKGGGTLTTDDLITWQACGDTFSDALEEKIAPYWLVTIRGNVIIEIKAYPETRVTREQLIAIAESMVPVSAPE
jgi:hypothetical protein